MTDDDTDHPPGFARRHRSAVMVGALVVALGGVIGLTVSQSRDGPGPTPAPSASPTTTVALSGAAAEMAGLLEAGAKLAYDGRYTTVSGPTGTVGALRLWSNPPLARVDTETGTGTELRRRAQFSLAAGTVGCARAVEGAWSCESRPGLPLGAGLVPEGFLVQLGRFTVEARSDRVGGRQARCFALTSPTQAPGEVCLTPEGILLRVQANSTRIELVDLDLTPPPAEIFELPAPLS